MKTLLSLFFILLWKRIKLCLFPIFLLTIISPLILFAQDAPPLDWQKKFGGSNADIIKCWIETDDGYLIGGASSSGISGDKTTPSKGGYDFWLIKTDKNGNKLWDKSFGGSSFEEIDKILKTSDGGFLLAGNSASEINSDKSDSSRGGADFWVIKITADGTKLWDHTFGGDNLDDLKDAIATSDGGFLLAGDSYSDQSGEKSEPSRSKVYDEHGYESIFPDYWVVKIDPSGLKQWDKTIGGGGAIPWYGRPGWDYLSSIVEANDGGFIIGGSSNSNNGYEKSSDAFAPFDPSSFPSYDFWIVKLNTLGKKVWDRTLGSTNDEFLSKIIKTEDGGYLLIGSEYEIWKVSSLGIRQWTRPQPLKVASATSDPTGYYIATFANSKLSLYKYSWAGKYLWTKSIEGSYSSFGFLEISAEKEFFLGATAKETSGETNYQVYNLKPDPTNYSSSLIFNPPTHMRQDSVIDLTVEHIYSPSPVTRVEFYANNVKIGEDGTSPYSYSWVDVAPGVYNVYVKAIEESGTSFSSLTKPLTIFQSKTEFYRAINFNGPEATLDDIKFESSGNTQNFIFQAKAFANQSIPLVPSTDSVRTAIIRSSLYSTSTIPATFTLTNVPAGTYEVYVYTWEDNNPALYSLWLEGQPVLENYLSGNKGSWVKLGPFKTTTSDGNLELKAAGGDANISAVEIWRVPGLQFYRAVNLNGPALKIDNVNFESSSNAANFSYQAKAFSNQSIPLKPKTDQARANMIRSSLYATKTIPATFTFSNVSTGTYDVFVYAWEDNYSQTFSVTINDSLVLADYKSGSAGSWRKLGPFRTTVSNGVIKVGVSGGDANISGIEIWRATGVELTKAININGPDLIIDNIKYESSNTADVYVYGNKSVNTTTPLIPETDANRAEMIRSSIYPISRSDGYKTYASVKPIVDDGIYDIYIYVWEDSLPQDYAISFNYVDPFKFEGRTGNRGQWTKLGPFRTYSIRIYGGLEINLTGKPGCTVRMSGIEIWRVTDTSIPRVPQSSLSSSSARSEASKGIIMAFPNPISQQLTVQLPSDYMGKVSLSVIDGIGINYLTQSKELSGESQIILDLPLSKMSTGLYFLKVKYDNKEEIIRLSKD